MKKEVLGAVIFISLLAFSGIAFASGGKLFASDDPVTLFIAVGNEYASQGDDERAIEAFEEALRYDAENAAALHNLGVIYHGQGDIEKAIALLGQSTQADASYAKAHYSLGLIHYRNKEFGKAIGELEKVVEIEADNANAHFDLAIIHIEGFQQKENSGTVSEEDLSDLREGILEYRKALEIDPQFPHAEPNAAIVENILNEYLSAR